MKKSICINLPERTDRKELAIEEFKKLDRDVLFVEALKVERDHEKITKAIKRGYIGLNLTIARELKIAIEEGVKELTIFEDDVVFIDDVQKIYDSEIKNLPEDASVLYWGSVSVGIGSRLVKGRIHKVRKAYYGHAITLYNKDGFFESLINELEKLEQPSDVCILNHYRDVVNGLKAYSFVKGIAYQRAGYSDNTEREENERLVD